MSKAKIIVSVAGILGGIFAGAVATGVARDAVDAFCGQVKVAPQHVPAADAGAP